MPGPLDDQTYTYPNDIGQRATEPLRPPAQASYPGLDDPSMASWLDPNSPFYQRPTETFRPERNIVPLDEAMAGTQAPLIPGRPSVPQNPPPSASSAPPAEVAPPEWMPADPATQSQTRYDPADTDRNGIVTEIERWLFHQQSNPDERRQEWLETNVWSQGNTADIATGMIIDGQTGEPIGRLPNFE